MKEPYQIMCKFSMEEWLAEAPEARDYAAMPGAFIVWDTRTGLKVTADQIV